ncbi:ScbA/BarX family gamma-butyrolactone biosynthesis protein [Streptomyces flavidovirens]|uniref:ScbA/BarX family gamma-butyrolactone biosynthesis protein n=1 Tax=Streptomyces flavidovirens TaxID=67298 RepID=UPI00041BA65A|nr:ScbA/BarX family gamma-butyrolactone biosynthesis protein [Streptomyces flavidovirens]
MPSTATHAAAVEQRPDFVARQLIHKANPAEVLMTGWRPDGNGGFVASAHWPASHGCYATGRTAVDPLLLTETVRQSLPLLCHGAYAVPMGHHLLWDTFSYELTPQALASKDRSGPLELHVTCLDLTRRGTRAAALTLLVSVVQGADLLAQCTTRLTVQAPAVYQRLRAGRGTPEAVTALPASAAAAISPSALGRARHRDVVLSPAGSDTSWRLRVDTTHPLFFDHPLDHAPGILLLEAARQAARMLPAPRRLPVMAMETSFFRYVELDAPCWIEAQPLRLGPDGHRRTVISLRQNGVEHFSAVVKLGREPDHRPLPSAQTGARIIPSPARGNVAVPVRA